jgi:23S rRNA pseudouridine1911/1915/1917 synthase
MRSNKNNLLILFEDNHIIIINKRVGDIVQGDKTGDTPLSDHVKQYIAVKYGKTGNVFLGVVHRLDRPTSGLVIFARTSKALERLNKMLREKNILKTYWAIVKNRPEKDKFTLINYLRKNPKNNKTTVFVKETKGAKKAILHGELIKELDNYYLLKIDLETGRHHQIRAQLSFINCPIRGDLKYGFNRSNKDGGISLHAREIEFLHPVTKKNVHLFAKTPNEVIWNNCN